MGSGSGLSVRDLGQIGGTEQHVLIVDEMPTHSHEVIASSETADDDKSDGNELGGGLFYHAPTGDSVMSPTTLRTSGKGQPHENMPPFLALNYCIALTGYYPSRDD